MTPSTPEEASALVSRLRLAVAKARSNSIEATGEFVTEMLSPEVMPGSLLNGALERVGYRPVTWGTLNNLLTLAHRSSLVVLAYVLRWDEDLPEPHSFPMYEGGDA